MIDLTKYTILELENIIKLATNEIINRKSVDLVNLRAHIDELIKAAGCTLEDILAIKTKPSHPVLHDAGEAAKSTPQSHHKEDNSLLKNIDVHVTTDAIEESMITETEKLQKAIKKTSVVEAKYRDLENPENTWSGRGKPPKWLQLKINAGAKKEDFLISPS